MELSRRHLAVAGALGASSLIQPALAEAAKEDRCPRRLAKAGRRLEAGGAAGLQAGVV